MAFGIPDAGNFVWLEGQEVTATWTRTGPTTATISWNLPPGYKIYNGALILLSGTEINPSNYPTDGQLYTASSDWVTPADMIGAAHVVGAFYNDVTTLSVNVTNLVSTDVYFASVHLISNVRTYFTLGSKAYPQDTKTDAFASHVAQSFEAPTSPTAGQYYYNLQSQLLYRWDGAGWVQVLGNTVVSGYADPTAGGFVGDLFYNINQRMLKTWNGSIWLDAETDVPGPMYNRINIGTDLTSDERLNLVDILKKQLGAPVVCVELTEDHWNIAIDNAIQECRHRMDNAYFRQYVAITVKQGQQTYYLNDPSIGTDKITTVIKVHRLDLLGLAQMGENGIYAQTFLNQMFHPGAQIDIVSVHLIHAMSEMFNRVFAGDIAFTWRETTRELTVLRRLYKDERVLVECAFEKTEQELLQDRYLMQWLQQWAEAEAMLMLGRIRGKYGNLPGPGGGLSLNADSLIADAKELQADCLRQISDFEVGNGSGEFGNYSFCIG